MQASRFDRFARAVATGADRRRVLGGLLAAAVGLPTARGAAAQGATPAAGGAPRWLYVQAFGSATLAPDPAAPGEYVLTLAGVDPAVLAFTDHPDRLVANVPADVFAAAVGRAAGDPLNATLAAPLAGGARAMVVVALRAAARDAAAGTATYRVAVLAEEAGPVRAAGTPVAAPAGEQAFDRGHLFVDADAECDYTQGFYNNPACPTDAVCMNYCCPSDRACPKTGGDCDHGECRPDHCCPEGTKCRRLDTCL